jgi:hypothetical protein
VSQDLSEFALHAWAILGLPIPIIRQHGPSASVVILPEGDSTEVAFSGLEQALSEQDVQLRLFGKPELSGRRRMGVALAKGSTIEEAKAALQFMIKEDSQKITTDVIIDCVCRYYRVDRDLVLGKSKKKEIVEPRQIAIYIITDIMDLPLTSIGQIFGKKDHTTIMYSRDKIANSLKTDQRLNVVIEDIKKLVFDK